jgi:TrmH family RNA methyltransferase
MLSKAQSKYIRSLTRQKFRDEYNAFIAEGEKITRELLNSDAHIKMIVSTNEWAADNGDLISRHPEATTVTVSESELQSVSQLQTSNQVLLVVLKPGTTDIPKTNEWYIALDDIQDPGNMGTIIRIADWFGIRHVVCSPGCVDVYNPKVVQSTMGSLLRVSTYETSLPEFLAATPLPKYAAALDGSNVYNESRAEAGILIIGNESKGISASVMSLATKKITIPAKGGAESLNAAVSAGILCALLLPK